MSDYFFVQSIIIILLMGFLALNVFSFVDSRLNDLDIKLSEINSSLDELSIDSSYLYYKLSVHDNIQKNGVLYEKEKGESIFGLHENNNFIYLNVRNRNSFEVCFTFLHELGHKVCGEDLSEACANFFREQNLYRCEGL